LLSDCDNNELCLGRTISWSPHTHWIYTKALPTFINGSCKYDFVQRSLDSSSVSCTLWLIQRGPKNRTVVLDQITLQRLMIERCVIRQSFRILPRMKCVICTLVQLNTICLICINPQYPQNCIEFDNNACVLLNFHSKYSKTRTISNTCGYSRRKST